MTEEFKIVSIGAGNIASHFIPALADIGCTISQVYSRDLKNARSLAIKVKAKPITDLALIDDTADFYLIMVHDDAIQTVLDQLPTLNNEQFLAHTSGATTINILKKKATNYGSFYALQSFKKSKSVDLQKTPFLVDGSNPKTIRKFRVLSRQLSPSVQLANNKERLQYHLAAVFVNNFTNHLACLSEQFLIANELDPKVLSAIISHTYESIKHSSACTIQTGPAIRDDNAVINKHLDLLKHDTTLTNIYKVLTDSIKNTANKDHNESS